MSKSVSMIIWSMILVFNCSAQINFIDSSKNEVGININPLLDPIGISTSSDYMTLQFKHHFSNVSFRLGLTGINTDTYSNYNLHDYQFRITDSSKVLDHFYDTKNSIRFNVGLEQQQLLKNKWKFFYGFDLIGGFTNNDKRLEQTTYIMGADSIFTFYRTTNDSIQFSEEYILVGAAFVAGLDYFFTKRISLGLQGYFPIIFEFQTGNKINKTSTLIFDQKFSILLRLYF